MRSMYNKTTDTTAYKGKKAKHKFNGEACSLKRFSSETKLPVYLIRHMLAKGYSMDELAANVVNYEQDGTFEKYRKEHSLIHKKYKSTENGPKLYFFNGQRTSIADFCRQNKFPESVVHLMLEDGLDMDDICRCWNLWISLGVIDEWTKLADKRFTNGFTHQLAEKRVTTRKANSDRDRIKLIMSVPVDPRKSGAYYHTQNYGFNSQKDSSSLDGF